MSLKAFFGILLALFFVFQIVILSAAISTGAFLERRSVEQSTLRSFEHSFESRRLEIVGDLMVGNMEILEARLANMERREGMEIYFVKHGETIQLPPRGQSIERSFFLTYAGTSYGTLIFRKRVESSHRAYLRPIMIFLILQLVFAAAVIFLLQRWTRRYLLQPIEKLIDGARRQEETNLSHWTPQEVSSLQDILRKLILDVRDKAHQAAVGELASRVAHDIRSPLAALEMLSGTLGETKQAKDLRQVAHRVRGIANALLEKRKNVEGHEGNLSEELLSPVIDEIVSEIRVLHSESELEICFEKTAANAFLVGRVNASELKRILSNILSNAVEACEGRPGKIFVELSQAQTIEIRISDNGCGISSDLLETLQTSAASFGKNSGHGIGLNSAREILKSWGGRLLLASRLTEGTAVTIQLPAHEKPRWLCEHIPLKSQIVILDDDPGLISQWKSTIGSAGPLELRQFLKPEEFIRWFFENGIRKRQDFLLLCDQRLGHREVTGLQVIRDFKLESQSILVTDQFENEELRKEVLSSGLQILPKSLIPFSLRAHRSDFKSSERNQGN